MSCSPIRLATHVARCPKRTVRPSTPLPQRAGARQHHCRRRESGRHRGTEHTYTRASSELRRSFRRTVANRGSTVRPAIRSGMSRQRGRALGVPKLREFVGQRCSMSWISDVTNACDDSIRGVHDRREGAGPSPGNQHLASTSCQFDRQCGADARTAAGDEHRTHLLLRHSATPSASRRLTWMR